MSRLSEIKAQLLPLAQQLAARVREALEGARPADERMHLRSRLAAAEDLLLWVVEPPEYPVEDRYLEAILADRAARLGIVLS